MKRAKKIECFQVFMSDPKHSSILYSKIEKRLNRQNRMLLMLVQGAHESSLALGVSKGDQKLKNRKYSSSKFIDWISTSK